MREFDALQKYPQTVERAHVVRTIQNKIIASYRDEHFFDGSRANGYGGLVDDGRWRATAEFMVQEYELKAGDRVLQIGCEKGFLLVELQKFGLKVLGLDTSAYAIECSELDYKVWPVSGYTLDGFGSASFALVLAIGPVYTASLPDAIKLIKAIQRVSTGKSFITLGSFDTREEEQRLRDWSLLGCTLLPKDDWREVLAHCEYTGDYKFITAKTLGLMR